MSQYELVVSYLKEQFSEYKLSKHNNKFSSCANGSVNAKYSNSTHLSIQSRVHPERLIKKPSAFRGIQMPIVSYITPNGFFLSWTKLIKFLPHTMFSQHFNYVEWLLKAGKVEKEVAAVVKQRCGKNFLQQRINTQQKNCWKQFYRSVG